MRHPDPPTNPPTSESAPDTDQSPAGEWLRLCALDEVPEAGGLYVHRHGRSYAVFRLGADRVAVMDDACPHAGGSLSAGELRDGCVICPWHAWPFELETGRCADNPNDADVAARMYQSRVVGRWVEVGAAVGEET